jgi:hypothetical protein
VRVTFEGIDFSVAPRGQINFSCFDFGNGADLSDCIWRGFNAIGLEALEIASNPDYFRPGCACFKAATFGFAANFDRVSFGSGASFCGATFDWVASFIGGTFGNDAKFNGATFRPLANFTGTTFGRGTEFYQTHFKGSVDFTGISEEQWTKNFANGFLRSSDASALLKQRHEETRYGSGPGQFITISFANARFDGEASFSGRSFEKTADFTCARFYYPPDFDDATKLGPKSRIPIRLRTFRKIAEETKNHDLERDLYIEERKAERGVYWHQRLEDLKKDGWRSWPRNAAPLFAHLLWIAVMGTYWALADYGRSFMRPFAWLIASGFYFYWCYGNILAYLAPKACPLADQYDHAVRMLALGNTVLFVGPLTIDSEIKKLLFCPLNNCPTPIIPPEGYQLAVLSQNLLSIILVFFIGLALRNYFKIK